MNELMTKTSLQKEERRQEKKLPAGIVLGGGGSKLAQIEDAAQKVFQLTASVGAPRNFNNIDQDPVWLTVCGLAAMGWKDQDEFGGSPQFSMGGWGKLKKFFKIFLP